MPDPPPAGIIRDYRYRGKAGRSFLYQRLRAILRHSAGNGSRRLAGAIRGNRLAAYWWNRLINAGDLVTPALLNDLGFTPVWEAPGRADAVAAGSILEHIPDNYAGCIIGAGFISAESRRQFSRAKMLAVRGRLTLDRTGAPADTRLGDPGLLTGRMLKTPMEKQYELGLVPHYTDFYDERIRLLCRRLGKKVKLIDLRRPPAAVLADLSACRAILSSSLHGLIFADGLGISSVWLVLSEKLSGGRFKFDDYYSAFGIRREPGTITGRESSAELVSLVQPPPAGVSEVKENLEQAFQRFIQYRLENRHS